MITRCWNCDIEIDYNQADIYHNKINIMDIHQPYIRCPRCNSQIAVVNIL